MSNGTKYLAEDVIEAIPGTGGIVTELADKLGVDRTTIYNYLDRWVTVREAWESEKEKTGDIAESVVKRNIELAHKKQKETNEQVSTSDARWYLSRVRRGKFALRKELTGGDGSPIEIEVVETNITDEDI